VSIQTCFSTGLDTNSVCFSHISPTTSKVTLFGDALSTSQKTNLGEAIDVMLYSRILPTSADMGTPLSFLDLFFHEQYGFKDDPVLLQRMWYIKAFVILLDGANGLGGGRRWKWYDHQLTLVIYSWVRHNRRYKVCNLLIVFKADSILTGNVGRGAQDRPVSASK
jgi:hypothetical protein